MAKGEKKQLENCFILGSTNGQKRSIVFKLRKKSGVEIDGKVYYYLMVTHKGELKKNKLARIRAILKETNDANIKKLVVNGWEATKQLAKQSGSQEEQKRQKYLLRGDKLGDAEKEPYKTYRKLFMLGASTKRFKASAPETFQDDLGMYVREADLDKWLEAAEGAIARESAGPALKDEDTYSAVDSGHVEDDEVEEIKEKKSDGERLAEFRELTRRRLAYFKTDMDKVRGGDKDGVEAGLYRIFMKVFKSLEKVYGRDPAFVDLGSYLRGMKVGEGMYVGDNFDGWISKQWGIALSNAEGKRGVKWTGDDLMTEFVNIVREDMTPFARDVDRQRLDEFRTLTTQRLGDFKAAIDAAKGEGESGDEIAADLHGIFMEVLESLEEHYGGDPAFVGLGSYLRGLDTANWFAVGDDFDGWVSEQWGVALRKAEGKRGMKWTGDDLVIEFVNMVRADMEPYARDIDQEALDRFRELTRECLAEVKGDMDAVEGPDNSAVAAALHCIFKKVLVSLGGVYGNDTAFIALVHYLHGMAPPDGLAIGSDFNDEIRKRWKAALRYAKGQKGVKWSGSDLIIEFVNMVRKDMEPYVKASEQ